MSFLMQLKEKPVQIAGVVSVDVLKRPEPPRSFSYVSVAASLDRAEKMKSRKYTAAAPGLNAEFTALIVTLQGDIGPSAVSLLEKLSSRATRPLNMEYRLLLTLIIQRALASAQLGQG
jgi:hypothetical protein